MFVKSTGLLHTAICIHKGFATLQIVLPGRDREVFLTSVPENIGARRNFYTVMKKCAAQIQREDAIAQSIWTEYVESVERDTIDLMEIDDHYSDEMTDPAEIAAEIRADVDGLAALGIKVIA